MHKDVRINRRLVPLMAVTALSLAAAGCGGDSGGGDDASPSAPAEGSGGDCASLYDGEDITLVVPYSPGGGFDEYARGLAPHLEEQLEGASVRVENMPGAGGLIGANAVFQAEPDGTTIGIINYPGAVFGEATGAEGVALKNDEWTFLGRVAAVNPLVYASTQSGIASSDDLLAAEEPVVFGIGGVGSDAYYATTVLGETLGFPYEIVAGYEGSGEADAALLAGEVEASVNSADSALQTIEGGSAVPLMVIGSEPLEQAPDVPTALSLAEGDQQAPLESLTAIYDLERIMVAPPGVPDEQATCLADALEAALADEGFVEEMEKAERTLNPLGREDTEALVEKASGGFEDLKPLLAGQ